MGGGGSRTGGGGSGRGWGVGVGVGGRWWEPLPWLISSHRSAMIQRSVVNCEGAVTIKQISVAVCACGRTLGT